MKLKFISFNIRFCDDPDGNSVAERAPRLAAITDQYDADVIGFQEYTPIWEEQIAKYYGEKYDMFSKYRSLTFDVEASPILWKKEKFDCLKTGYFWLSDTPEVESRGWDEFFHCTRMCLYVILKEKSSGKIFTFMNVHFGGGDNGQIKSCDLVHAYAQKISDYPTVLVGDFNMTPESAPYAHMVKLFRDINTETVQDDRMTFHCYVLDYPDGRRIDYCFVNEQVTPVTQELLNQLVDGKFPSDHYGLYNEVEL